MPLQGEAGLIVGRSAAYCSGVRFFSGIPLGGSAIPSAQAGRYISFHYHRFCLIGIDIHYGNRHPHTQDDISAYNEGLFTAGVIFFNQ
jgi:hypothetical protein